MSEELELWHGRSVQVLHRKGSYDFYDVIVCQRSLVAKFPSRTWANAFAEVIESFIPEGTSARDAERYAEHGLFGLPATRFLVAGVLRRAAELQMVKSLESLNEQERQASRQISRTLQAEAEILERLSK